MNQEKKGAVLLLRVSTDKQFYESQETDLKNYAIQKGFEKFHIIGTKETGFSEIEDKIGTNEMFTFIDENPEFNTVFCTELSRIGRTQIILLQVRDLLIKRKIQLHIKDSGFSLFQEGGKVSLEGSLSFTLFALFSENEVEQRKLRFARKKRQQMLSGDSFFGGKVLFGYKLEPVDNNKNSKNVLVKDEEQEKLIIQIYNWYLNGFDEFKNPSILTITRHCIAKGKHSYTHSKRNVTKLLSEEAYTGLKTTNNKRKNPKFGIEDEPKYILTENTIKYPQIIDKNTFEAVKEKRKKNRYKADKKTKRTTILKGILLCPNCGKRLQGEFRWRNGEIKHTYRCSGRHYAVPCENKSTYSMMMLDGIIWGMIKTDIKALSKIIKQISPNIKLAELITQKKNLVKKLEELRNESENIVNIQMNRPKLKNINYTQLIEKENKSLLKIDKEITYTHNSLATLESSILIAERKQNDIAEVFKSNIGDIENDSQLIKKYINYFISEINILHHDRERTFLKVHFKYYTPNNENIVGLSDGKRRLDDGLGENVFVLINKKNTINTIARKDIKIMAEDKLVDLVKKGKLDNGFVAFSWKRLKHLYEQK